MLGASLKGGVVMYPECQGGGLSRRDFITRSCAAVAAATAVTSIITPSAAQDAPTGDPLPTIQLGDYKVSRMVAGYNPIGGHSHTTLDMARHMREYFTPEQTADFLIHCERMGINTWQYDRTDKVLEALTIARDKGCGIQLICLQADGSDESIAGVMEQQPIAIVHHGGVTDGLFAAGRQNEVRDFVKKVKDAGCLAGVSSHCPDNIKRIADEGWENDLFMTCLYYVTRPREEMERDLGKVPVGEPFFESDRDDMTSVVLQIEKPCLVFKILAAGRSCWSEPSTRDAFRYAFERIKPIDGMIVGMFPRYSDQVAENAGYVREFGGVA